MPKKHIKNRSLMDNIQGATVVHDTDTSIVYGNNKALDLLSLNSDQVLGRTAFDLDRQFLIKTITRSYLMMTPLTKYYTR